MKKDMKDNTMIGAALITLASGIVLCFLSFFCAFCPSFLIGSMKSILLCCGILGRRCFMLQVHSGWQRMLRRN